MLNGVKHLAIVSDKVPARDPSFLRMTLALLFFYAKLVYTVAVVLLPRLQCS